MTINEKSQNLTVGKGACFSCAAIQTLPNMSMLEAVKSKRFDLIVEKLKVSQRSKDSDVKESFEVFTKAQSSAFWELVKQQSLPCIDRTLVRCGEGITESSEEMEEDLTVLKSVMHAIVTYYGVSKFKPPALFDILEQTQGVLACTSPLPSIHALQFTVAKLCELWWLNNDEGAENLIAQLITYLLMSSLSIEGHDANIKRLYALRAGFLLFDLESKSSAFLRDLIERCFVHPAFMKGSEGQRLLAFLLGANQGLLVNLVASVIRPQLATGVKTVATAYGKILYLAWKDAQASGAEDESDADKSELRRGRDRDEAVAVDGAVAAQALEDSIQSLLRDGVHAAEAKYFRGVRFLLQGFHDVPRAKLDAMLLRVYDPILWRSMRCANATVRAQAAVVFLDVFPLQHADGRAEENDKLLQKQFDLLAALLTDSDHQVRAHAALGVCHILREYWESLPLNTTHNILKFLIDTLSVDASCANVRHAVFVGLGELFQQPLTHTLLKQLLPLLRNSIHDKAEKVRVAFIKILCQIKGIRGMHFYEIVPVDHLLERLVEDRHCAQASRALTELLLNSFYPQGEGTATAGAGAETEQLNRCLQFVEKNPAAAEVFYSNLRHFVSIGHVAKLVTLLFTFLVTAESRRMGASAASAEAADEGTDENAGGKRRRANKVTPVVLSFNIKMGAIRIIQCLIASVDADLPRQQPSRDLLAKYLTVSHAHSLLLACTHSDPAEAVHLLPGAFSLVSFAMRLGAATSAPGKGKKGASKPAAAAQHSEEDLEALVREIYCPAWAAASAESGRAALSRAVAEVFCNAHQQAKLVALMSQAFAAAVKAPAGEVAVKKTGKRSKASAESVSSLAPALLSVEVAVDLLSACAGEALVGVSQEMDDLFELVRSMVSATLTGSGAKEVPPTDAAKALQAWLSFCVQRDALVQLQNVPDDATSSAETDTSPSVCAALAWATAELVPALADENSSALAAPLLGVVVASVSDMLYMDLATADALAALQECLDALRAQAAAAVVDSLALAPSLARLQSILGTAAPAPEQGSDASVVGSLKTALAALTRQFPANTGAGKSGKTSGAAKTVTAAADEQAEEEAALATQVWEST